MFPVGSHMADTRVEVTVPIHQVTASGILAFQCKIWNLQDDNMVNILRVVNGRAEPITTGDGYIPSPVHDRVFLDLRTAQDESVVYFVTILDITDEDNGEYMCKVVSIVDGDYVNIAKDSIEIIVYSYPNRKYPICTSLPVSLHHLSVKDTMTLTCASEITVPMVDLLWEQSGSRGSLQTSRTVEGNIVYFIQHPSKF